MAKEKTLIVPAAEWLELKRRAKKNEDHVIAVAVERELARGNVERLNGRLAVLDKMNEGLREALTQEQARTAMQYKLITHLVRYLP